VQTDWMRKIKDVGLIPETDYSDFAGDKSMYDYMRSPACPFDELMEASDLATMGGKKDINDFVRYLKSPNSAIRYWGVTGLLIIKNDARPALAALKNAAKDKSGAVATMAAEALYGLGEKKLAIETYMRILSPETYNVYSMIFALNSIDAINDSSAELITPLQQKFVELSKYMGPEKNYIAQNVNYLLIKWGILK
jgi:N-sulfoglucosamine sulfohydrolase